jgi:hypothetical protein
MSDKIEVRIKSGFGPHKHEGRIYRPGETLTVDKAQLMVLEGDSWKFKPPYASKFDLVSGETTEPEPVRAAVFNLQATGGGYYNIYNANGVALFPKHKRWAEASAIYENLTGEEASRDEIDGTGQNEPETETETPDPYEEGE